MDIFALRLYLQKKKLFLKMNIFVLFVHWLPGTTALCYLLLLSISSGDGLTLRDWNHTVLYKHSSDSSVRSCRVKLWEATVSVKQWTDGELVGTVCWTACTHWSTVLHNMSILTGHLVLCVVLDSHFSQRISLEYFFKWWFVLVFRYLYIRYQDLWYLPPSQNNGSH